MLKNSYEVIYEVKELIVKNESNKPEHGKKALINLKRMRTLNFNFDELE